MNIKMLMNQTLIFIKGLALFILLAVLGNNAVAQVTPILTSKAPIPEEFISPAKGRFEKEKASIETKEKSKVKKAKTEFYLQSNYQLDYLLKSGKVVFNESVFVYLNKVSQIILKQYPELQGKIKIYPIKIDQANAFTFNEGYVFVNIGLIARLDNEAELAFILCHEISHYVNKHSIKKLLKNQQIQKTTAKQEEAYLKMSRYSRENEFEADKEGLQMLLKSPYNKNSAITALEMLYLSDMPFENMPFQKSYFETGTLFIPETVIKKNKPITKSTKMEEVSEENDSLATHPAIEDRVKVLKQDLEGKNTSGKDFIGGTKEEFEQIREICRLEMGRLYSHNEEFSKGLYHNFLLLQKSPNNQIAVENKSILLAKLCVAQQHNSMKKILTDGQENSDNETEIDEEEKKIQELLLSLNKEEFHLLALKNAVVGSKQFPEDPLLKSLSQNLIADYRKWYGRGIKEFAPVSEFSKENVEGLYVAKTEEAPKDKNERIKKAKAKKVKFQFNNSFARYAISDLIATDTAFVNVFNQYASGPAVAEDSESNEEEDSEDSPNDNSKSKTTVTKKPVKEKRKEPGSLGTNRILLLDPQYTKRDDRKGKKADYIGDEQTEQKLINIIEVAGNSAGMSIELLAPNEMNNQDIVKFNDYGVLKNWISETASHYENPHPSTYNAEIKEIMGRYNVRYMTLIFSKAKLEKRRGNYFFGASLMFLLQPFVGIALMAKGLFPERSLNLAIAIFDLQENKLIYLQEYDYDTTDSDDLMKSQLYAIFQKIKK